MKRLTLTHILLAVTWAAILASMLSRYLTSRPYQGFTNDGCGIYYTHGAEGEKLATVVDEQAAMRSSDWHPADRNPPVSARTALAIAERFRRERLVDKPGWRWGLSSLTLYPLIDGKSHKWCWCIHFEADSLTTNVNGSLPSFDVFVLMNGEVILPESDSLKNWGMMVDVEKDSTHTTK